MTTQDLERLLKAGYSVHFDTVDRNFVKIRVVKNDTRTHWAQGKNIVDIGRSDFVDTAISAIELSEKEPEAES